MSEPVDLRLQLWILGLNHAGTTIFWRAWRKDDRFLCFDEPLTAHLGLCFPRNNSKRTFDEYLQIFGEEPKRFWELYDPIYPLQELDHEFVAGQERYLRYLIAQAPCVAIDETHIHLHLPALQGLSRNPRVIHLHRRASAFATSHLLPRSARGGVWIRRAVRRLRHAYDRGAFWTRSDFIPAMCRGEVIGSHIESKFGMMLAEAGYDVERIMAAPTLVRLLAYWHYHYHYLEREGRRCLGERFTSLRYEEFASSPTAVMRRLYGWLGLLPPAADYPEVHPPKPPFRELDPRWHDAARTAGFTEEEIGTLL